VVTLVEATLGAFSCHDVGVDSTAAASAFADFGDASISDLPFASLGSISATDGFSITGFTDASATDGFSIIGFTDASATDGFSITGLVDG